MYTNRATKIDSLTVLDHNIIKEVESKNGCVRYSVVKGGSIPIHNYWVQILPDFLEKDKKTGKIVPNLTCWTGKILFNLIFTQIDIFCAFLYYGL